MVNKQVIGRDDDSEDDENKTVPSFQNAFSDALLMAATESVKAATRSMFLYNMCLLYLHVFTGLGCYKKYAFVAYI